MARCWPTTVRAFRPDVVLGGNGPLEPQAMLLAVAGECGAGFVFWLQDAYGIAIDQLLRRKLPGIGALVGTYYRVLERRLWHASDAIVAITEDFRPMLAEAGIERDRVRVIQNWAPLDELPQRPRANPWAAAHGLTDKRVLLYSGTMGLKHDPALLVHLARQFKSAADVRVVVVSEGIGADHIARARQAEGLDNLLVLPFQPYEALPDVTRHRRRARGRARGRRRRLLGSVQAADLSVRRPRDPGRHPAEQSRRPHRRARRGRPGRRPGRRRRLPSPPRRPCSTTRPAVPRPAPARASTPSAPSTSRGSRRASRPCWRAPARCMRAPSGARAPTKP